MLGVIAGIAAQAQRNGGTPALISGGRVVGYGDLLDAIARVSNYFAGRGLKAGTKLFINVADPDLRLVITLAAMHCGLIPFAILEVGDLGDELDYDLVVGGPALQSPAPAPDLMIDQSVLSGQLSDGTLREFPETPVGSILYVASTTGTTGRRKLLASIRRAPTSYRLFAPGNRLLVTMGDVTFAGVGLALRALLEGVTFVRASRDKAECVRHIALYGVTQMYATSGALTEMMDAMDTLGITCPSLRTIVLGGSLFAESLVARAAQHFTAELVVSYGSSEVGRVSHGVITAADFRFGYVGELSPGVTLVAAGTRQDPAPIVLVHNPATYTPYYRKGKVEPFNGTLFTMPDLGFLEGSSVYIAGRDDEVLNVSGNKTAFSLIEAAVRAEPGIRDVAVVSAAGVGDVSGVVIAVVATATVDLRRVVAAVAAAVKTPHAASKVRVFRIDGIPRNDFGKTDREGVLAAYRSHASLP